MAVTIENDPQFGFLVFGDSAGVLGDHVRAGDQSINESGDATDRPVGTLVGDASGLIDQARGGDDEVRGTGFQSLSVFGDAFDIGNSARGGSDALFAGAQFSATAFGDARTISGAGRGGDDFVQVGSDFASIGYGDALELRDRARGGDDWLEALGFRSNDLFGDGRTLSGRAEGGDDRLIGGDLSVNRLFGDAQTLEGATRGGDDLLIGGAGAEGGPTTTNLMYGDGESLADRARAGSDTLVSGAFADDTMWGDAAEISAGAVTGQDRFVFTPNTGHDRIMDFESQDVIEFRGFGVDDFDDLGATIENTAEGVLISFNDGGSILLAGVSQFDPDNIIFA